MRDLDELFARLARSNFRQRFHLRGADLDYLKQKGLAAVMDHAAGFIGKRLAPARPDKDGKQTPWKGHPVFVAQHATGTCCRGCLAKWHGIAAGKALEVAEQTYVLTVIERWLRTEAPDAPERDPTTLFG